MRPAVAHPGLQHPGRMPLHPARGTRGRLARLQHCRAGVHPWPGAGLHGARHVVLAVMALAPLTAPRPPAGRAPRRGWRRRAAMVLPVILFILSWSLLGVFPLLAAMLWICGVGH